MILGTWLILMRPVESLKVSTLMGFFCPKHVKFKMKKYRGVMPHDTEEWCKVRRKKLTLGSKNNIRNLINFDGSSDKSKNLHFDMLLLSIASEVSIKKGKKSYLYLKSDPNFEEKLPFSLKNDMRNLVNFYMSSGESANLHYDGLLL